MKKIQLSYPILIIGISLAGAFSITHYMFPASGAVEFFSGWVLAFLNHLAGRHIKETGIKKDGPAAIRHLSTLNFLRFILLLFFVLGAITLFPASHEVFICALLSSYVIFMTGDLIQFYRFYKQRS